MCVRVCVCVCVCVWVGVCVGGCGCGCGCGGLEGVAVAQMQSARGVSYFLF